MIGKHIQLFYHSGTGNTLLIIKEMLKVFRENGIEVSTFQIDTSSPEDINPEIPTGLAFPVAFQSTFPFILDFINRMPEADGTPVFMVDTLMAFSGAVIGPVKKLLTKKGYKCIGAEEIVMPNNWLRKNIDAEKDKKIIKKGIQKARIYAENLLAGRTKWKRIPFVSDGLYYFCCNDLVMKQINLSSGKKIKVDKDRCTHCGLCSRLCPCSNITMNIVPLFSTSCQLCMRCLSYCPAKAIFIPGKIFKQYQAAGAAEMLKNSIDIND